MRALPLLVGLLLPTLALAQPGADEDALVVIHAKAVITVSGETLTPGSIVIRNGKIEALGQRVDVPPQARVIDARDQVAMPALIDPRTRFSLRGYNRAGNHAGNSAQDELLLRPGQLEPVLAAGFGVLGVIPDGSGLPGRTAVVELPEARPLEAMGYLRVTMRSLPRDKATLAATLHQAQQAIEKEAQAREAWEKKHGVAGAGGAEAGKKGPPPRPGPRHGRGGKAADLAAGEEADALPEEAGAGAGHAEVPAAVGELAETAPVDTKTAPPPFEAPKIPGDLVPLVDLLRKTKDAPRLLIELGSASDLLHFEELRERYEIEPFAFLLDNRDQSDLFHVVQRLGEAKARVLVYPEVSTEPYSLTRRNLPAELARAGARVAFLPRDDDREGHERLLESLALLQRDGLPRDVALAGVTLRAAELLGLEASLGSLEAGKRGHVLLLDRDPLEPGARVTRVVLAGESVWTEE